MCKIEEIRFGPCIDYELFDRERTEAFEKLVRQLTEDRMHPSERESMELNRLLGTMHE